MSIRMRAATSVRLGDSFWRRYQDLVHDEILPYQLRALNDEDPSIAPSHAIENLRIAAGQKQGDFYGMVFQDSDVAKWIEAAAYSLRNRPDKSMEKEVDDLVALLGQVQDDDGYLNSYFSVTEPRENRWTNLRDCHELYCAGHLIEAGVAYYEATGKDTLLNIVKKYADLICQVFGNGRGQIPGYPGHPEIEIALVRLYEATGEPRYLKQADYFLRQRGTEPHYFVQEAEARKQMTTPPKSFDIINPADVDDKELNYGLGFKFQQAHMPFLEQREAFGHAVRASYLYTGAAATAYHTESADMLETVHALWNDITTRKMYVTGCVGSQVPGESFTDGFDLPNKNMYCETCASVALAMFARRMLLLEPRSQYADVLERTLYNGCLAGMDLDGKAYFYINPQQYEESMDGRILGWDVTKPRNRREPWLDCACCPANLGRLLASFEDYLYTFSADTLYVNLYATSAVSVPLTSGELAVNVTASLPWNPSVSLTVREGTEGRIALRIPEWTDSVSLNVNGTPVEPEVSGGYAILDRDWNAGDVINAEFAMPVIRVRANPLVSEDNGLVAFQRGPIVYAFEETDNGNQLGRLRIPSDAEIFTAWQPSLLEGVTTLSVDALRTEVDRDTPLYLLGAELAEELTSATAVPYYAWANREPGDMRIWMRE